METNKKLYFLIDKVVYYRKYNLKKKIIKNKKVLLKSNLLLNLISFAHQGLMLHSPLLNFPSVSQAFLTFLNLS